jgi:CheY-like chemotaxis protein
MVNKILLVDDKLANLVAYKEILSALNVICICAKSGKEALLKLKSNTISLVLLDM